MQLSFASIIEQPVYLFEKNNIAASVLRLDRLHPVISGNKWFKLQYYLNDAREQNKKRIITFGGSWSNHVVATAAACRMNGLASVGIIRGEMPLHLSATLIDAMELGMEFHFINRDEYRDKIIPAGILTDEDYIINEGGFGPKGAQGAGEILNYCQKDFTYCCCAVGTGTMMAGLLNAITATQKIIGISVLKNAQSLEKDVAILSNKEVPTWKILHDYHFGGYAKQTTELIRFMNEFYEQTKIPLDFVYTAKLFYAVTDLVRKDFFPPGSRLLLIHSGGLQGNQSLRKGSLIY